MVGLLGCGCCACCAEPTSNWAANFATTPTVGAVWDEVTLVSGAGTRSYAPVKPTGNSSKISRLTIDADQASPLYQGFNNFPRGVKFDAFWQGKPDPLSINGVESMWYWRAPAAQAGQRHIMRLEIYTELIYNVGADELRTGIYSMWQKNFDGTYSGTTSTSYTTNLYGYLQVNGGTRTKQTEYGPLTFSYGTTRNGPCPLFRIKHETDRSGAFDNKCTQISEAKYAFTETFKADNSLDSFLAVGQQPRSTSVDDQKFDCFVGWNSEVHWTTIVGSGMGLPVGTFDFNSYFMEWKSASWL